MICTSCETIYSPTEDELGKVDTLAGFCDKCGTEPRLKRFAVAFNEGAIAGVLAIEFLFLLVIISSWLKGLVPPLVVALICFAVYKFASRSEPIRYENKKHRLKATLIHRIVGGVLGFAVGLGTILAFLSL